MNVYVISAGMRYEGSKPIMAFGDKAKAEAFLADCTQYHETRPIDVPSVDAPDTDWDAYFKALDSWAKLHPAGEVAKDEDYFALAEIPFSADEGQ